MLHFGVVCFAEMIHFGAVCFAEMIHFGDACHTDRNCSDARDPTTINICQIGKICRLASPSDPID